MKGTDEGGGSLFGQEPSPEQMRRCTRPHCGELNPPLAEFCSKCGMRLKDRKAGAADTDEPQQELVIELGRTRRLAGLAMWLGMVGVVAGVLVFLFVQFTASLRVSVGLVSFMLAYMGLMAWMTMRK